MENKGLAYYFYQRDLRKKTKRDLESFRMKYFGTPSGNAKNFGVSKKTRRKNK